MPNIVRKAAAFFVTRELARRAREFFDCGESDGHEYEGALVIAVPESALPHEGDSDYPGRYQRVQLKIGIADQTGKSVDYDFWEDGDLPDDPDMLSLCGLSGKGFVGGESWYCVFCPDLSHSELHEVIDVSVHNHDTDMTLRVTIS